jgi:hypothetical protein
MKPFFGDNTVKELRVLSFRNKRFQQEIDALYKVGNNPTICSDKAFQKLRNYNFCTGHHSLLMLKLISEVILLFSHKILTCLLIIYILL